jgi:hypothetical protein
VILVIRTDDWMRYSVRCATPARSAICAIVRTVRRSATRARARAADTRTAGTRPLRSWTAAPFTFDHCRIARRHAPQWQPARQPPRVPCAGRTSPCSGLKARTLTLETCPPTAVRQPPAARAHVARRAHGPQPATAGPVAKVVVLGQRRVVVGLGGRAGAPGQAQDARGPGGEQSGTGLAVRRPIVRPLFGCGAAPLDHESQDSCWCNDAGRWRSISLSGLSGFQ